MVAKSIVFFFDHTFKSSLLLKI